MSGLLRPGAKRYRCSFPRNFRNRLPACFKLRFRQDNVSDIVIPVLLVSQFLQSVRIGMLSANFVQDRRDNPANPHHGMYNTASFGLSGRFFGSQRSFGRALVRNATYYSLGKNLVLARQTQFGVIVPFSPPAGHRRTRICPAAGALLCGRGGFAARVPL